MQAVLQIATLPESALDAASEFTVTWLPAIREHLTSGEGLIVALPAAPYDHADWRRGAVRDLARAYAPLRVNFVAGGSEHARDAAIGYLSDAPGVTGQYLPLSDAA